MSHRESGAAFQEHSRLSFSTRFLFVAAISRTSFRSPKKKGMRRETGAEEGVREDEADIVVHLERGTAYLNGSAHHHTVSILPEQRLSHLEIRDRAAATAACKVVRPNCARDPQFCYAVHPAKAVQGAVET